MLVQGGIIYRDYMDDLTVESIRKHSAQPSLGASLEPTTQTVTIISMYFSTGHPDGTVHISHE